MLGERMLVRDGGCGRRDVRRKRGFGGASELILVGERGDFLGLSPCVRPMAFAAPPPPRSR